jgi:hypothetical protein
MNDKFSITEHVTVPGLIERGMVVAIDPQGLWVGIESEMLIDAHDCHGQGKNGHCLYISSEIVKRIHY